MKPSNLHLSIMSMLTILVTFSSCQKHGLNEPELKEEQILSAKTQGHLNQTKTFSSDALLRWMDYQLELNRINGGLVGGPAGMRVIAYSGIAAYESVVPGMPAYQSLSGQLQDMPAMPQVMPGYAYYWPQCVNAAMASITKNFLTINDQQKVAVDQFAAQLSQEFASQGASADLLERSAMFGFEVAGKIFEWSQTDKTNWPAQPFTTSTQFNVQTGKWVPTNGTNTGFFPYWGNTRLFSTNSLNGINRQNPYIYSTGPGSAFRIMVEQVYNKTYDPNNLSADEKQKIAIYYRDSPGYGSGHYLYILRQVLAKAGSALDISSLVFAQFGMAAEDAIIGCFQVKYDIENNYVVRPVTYIKHVILGDPSTTWNPALGGTPNHSEYPSGHSTIAGAVSAVLTRHFGTNFPFTNSIYEGWTVPGYPGNLGSRHYTSFDQMAKEIGESRVYGQIHYPRSCEDGKKLGEKVAENILNSVNFLKE